MFHGNTSFPLPQAWGRGGSGGDCDGDPRPPTIPLALLLIAADMVTGSPLRPLVTCRLLTGQAGSSELWGEEILFEEAKHALSQDLQTQRASREGWGVLQGWGVLSRAGPW